MDGGDRKAFAVRGLNFLDSGVDFGTRYGCWFDYSVVFIYCFHSSALAFTTRGLNLGID